MFMQDIRRATKKHRKVLLAVVILLMIGLVGSFATWNAGGRGGIPGDPGGVSGASALEQQINYYLSYVSTMEAEAAEYSDYLNLAQNYMQLSYLFSDKYSVDTGNVPEPYQLEYDEEGNEIPLDPAQEAARAALEAEREAALAIADTSLEACRNSAGWARVYFQKALDNAPAGLNNAAIAFIKAGQAEACDIEGNMEGALAYMSQAYDLSPENTEYMMNLAYLHRMAGNLEDALELVEQAAVLYPDNIQLLMEQASLNADLERGEEAKALYQQARVLEPEDFNVAYSYAVFLLFNDSVDAGLDELRAYRDSLPEDHPSIASADAGIENLESWASLVASMGEFNVIEDGEDAEQGYEGQDYEVYGDDSETGQDGEENGIIEAPEV